MTENEVHQKFSAWLNARWIPFIHSRTDRRTSTQRGDPDFLIAWMGHCLFIEVKVDKNKLSPIQESRIAYIRKSGNRVEVCHSVEECIEATKTILCENVFIRDPRARLDAVGGNCCKIGIQTK